MTITRLKSPAETREEVDHSVSSIILSLKDSQTAKKTGHK